MVLERDKKGQMATAELPASDLPKALTWEQSPPNSILSTVSSNTQDRDLIPPRELRASLPLLCLVSRLEPPIQYMPWAPLVNLDPGLSLRI